MFEPGQDTSRGKYCRATRGIGSVLCCWETPSFCSFCSFPIEPRPEDRLVRSTTFKCFFLSCSFVALPVYFGSLLCCKTHPWPTFIVLEQKVLFIQDFTANEEKQPQTWCFTSCCPVEDSALFHPLNMQSQGSSWGRIAQHLTSSQTLLKPCRW